VVADDINPQAKLLNMFAKNIQNAIEKHKSFAYPDLCWLPSGISVNPNYYDVSGGFDFCEGTVPKYVPDLSFNRQPKAYANRLAEYAFG
jgi:hypothetical protein